MSSSAPTAATSAPWWPTGWPWSTRAAGGDPRHPPRRPLYRAWGGAAHRGRAGPAAVPGPLARGRGRLCAPAADPPPDSGLRAGRLPGGLAAWIVEKWRAWSDCDGQVERRFTKDQLLTTVMLYWVTGTIGSSFRFHRDWALGAASLPEALAEALADRDAVPLGWWRRCAGASASRSRLRWRCSTYPALGSGPSGSMVTCAASPTWLAAGTSRPWKSLSCWPRTCAGSSGLCADPAPSGDMDAA